MGSGWGTHVYLWQIHFDIWQNQYNIVKFKNKIKKNTGIETCIISYMKQVASPGSTHDTGCLGLVHWDDPEG